jgi:hypothetical protein
MTGSDDDEKKTNVLPLNGTPEKKPEGVAIATSDEVLSNPKYFNIVMANYCPLDFTLDFACASPMLSGAPHLIRMVCSPQSFKLMAISMKNVLERYENDFGEIKIERQGPAVIYETPKIN